MKRIITIVVVLAILGVFGKTLLFLYNKSQADPVVYDTVSPTEADIIKKTVATGSIIPRKEVALKPRVSGILTVTDLLILYVEQLEAARTRL